MEIRKDKWHYRLWAFTFSFSNWDGNPPKRTIRWRYWFRLLTLWLPVGIGVAGLIAAGVVITLAGNMITILTGSGIYDTWSTHGSYVREFKGFVVNKTRVSPQFVAGTLWACAAVAFLWHQYPQEFVRYSLAAIQLVLIVLVAIVLPVVGTIWFADKREEKDSRRLRRMVVDAGIKGTPIPPEIVTFVDPSSDSKEG